MSEQPSAIEASKSTTKRGGKRHRKQENNQFRKYIRTLFAQVGDDSTDADSGALRISRKSVDLLNNFCNDVLQKATAQSTELTRKTNHKTITAADVQAAIGFSLPFGTENQLRAQATKSMIQSVAKFNASFPKKTPVAASVEA